MSRASLTGLKLILDQVNNLSRTDNEAKTLESFIDLFVSIILNMSSPKNDFLRAAKG